MSLSKTLLLTVLSVNFCLNNLMSTMLLSMISCLCFCLMLSAMLWLISSKPIILMLGLVIEVVVVEMIVVCEVKSLIENPFFAYVHVPML